MNFKSALSQAPHDASPDQPYTLQPFLKWAGGKRQLLPEIRKFIPFRYSHYFEPFVGAGAVLFDLQPKKATINDCNPELVNCYHMIKEHPEELIACTQRHQINKEAFYALRALDRSPAFQTLSSIERAGRIIYLNRTCFNGLFRVNSRGQFNVPFGDYTNPRIIDPDMIRALSSYLNEAQLQILHGDFDYAVASARGSDFIYLDPPYDPVSDTSSFTGYSVNSFTRSDQERLRKVCDMLVDRGCAVLQSNSATEYIRDLYSDSRYTIFEVAASRNINSIGTGRKKISEVLIRNRYECR